MSINTAQYYSLFMCVLQLMLQQCELQHHNYCEPGFIHHNYQLVLPDYCRLSV